MSGKQAKRHRRSEIARLEAMLLDAHNHLHDGNVDACHSTLHAALGINDGEGVDTERGERLARMGDFDAGFRRLCQRTGVVAGFVAVGEGGRAVTGGNADVAHSIKIAFRNTPEGTS